MDKMEKSHSSLILYIVVIMAIVIGGYYLIKYQGTYTSDNKEYNNENVLDNIKIDDSKDYIYFENETKISDNFSVTYKDIVININNDEAKKLQDELNSKMSDARGSVVNVTDDIETETGSNLNADIYSADVIEYKVYQTSDYLSLVVSTYSYNVLDGNTLPSNSYYVFDLSNGVIGNNNSILKKYGITDQEVRAKMRSYLNTVTDADIDTILNGDYYLIVGDNGKVMINFVVKSTSFNYNESIEMD